MNDCIFCKIVAGQIKAAVVFENDRVLAFRDINPQAPVHVLIIPKKHFESVSAVSGADDAVFADLHKAAVAIASQEGVLKTGYRLVTNDGANAGQTVAHLHYHLLGGRRMTWPPG